MLPMSLHRTHLSWRRNAHEFTYENYSREHQIKTENGFSFSSSATPEYKGDAKLTNPEELLVAAISSCHMLTFLAIAAKKGFVVEEYDDAAEGILERPDGMPMHVARCILKPKIRFADNTPDADTLASLHAQAHRGCFIANSVKTKVEVQTP